MSRYVMTFSKKNNMRFISHLDMQRLFRRVFNRAGIKLKFSQGFNPHPITNTVMPLSLGFEADCDYFEFETDEALDLSGLCGLLNESLPDGISFTDVKEIPHEKKNLSAVCEFSSYTVFVPGCSIDENTLNRFLAQDEIYVLKRDKKTKTMVEKNIKNWIFSVSVPRAKQDGQEFDMILRAAPNETLNPLQLTQSMLKFTKQEIPVDIRITRTDLYYTEDGRLKRLFER